MKDLTDFYEPRNIVLKISGKFGTNFQFVNYVYVERIIIFFYYSDNR